MRPRLTSGSGRPRAGPWNERLRGALVPERHSEGRFPGSGLQAQPLREDSRGAAARAARPAMTEKIMPTPMRKRPQPEASLAAAEEAPAGARVRRPAHCPNCIATRCHPGGAGPSKPATGTRSASRAVHRFAFRGGLAARAGVVRTRSRTTCMRHGRHAMSRLMGGRSAAGLIVCSEHEIGGRLEVSDFLGPRGRTGVPKRGPIGDGPRRAVSIRTCASRRHQSSAGGA